jgi:DNA-directed RNA polymerase specialized sigma24 family protein
MMLDPSVYAFIWGPLRSAVAREIGWDRANDVAQSTALAMLATPVLVHNPHAYAKLTAQYLKIHAIHEIERCRDHISYTGLLLYYDKPDPEAAAIAGENLAICQGIFQVLPRRDRELLQRYYVDGETHAEIVEAMHFTPTQFRLCKFRAKARLARLAQARLRGGH